MEEPQRLWGRNGEAVRRGIEAGKILHINTASEEIADEFLLFRCRGCVSSKISFGPQLNGYVCAMRLVSSGISPIGFGCSDISEPPGLSL